MNKWILIEVENQSINEPDTYETHDEAYAEMERRFNELVEDDDEASIHSDYACIQTDNYNVDWKIFEVVM